MKKALLFLCLGLIPVAFQAQNLYFPPLVGNTWNTTSPESLGWCPDKIAELLDYLEDKNTKAFILLKDGKIVIEEYFGTFTQDSVWYWASAGKTLTAFTVGIAQQEGHLSIEDATSDYLGTGWTSCTPEKEANITIRHQLTMTSGLDDGTGDPYCTLPNCLQYKADAGTRWAYHNGPYTLLDGVIEAATGQTLNAYVTQKIKAQTGMTGAFFQIDDNNVFISKPRSMARFGLLILNRGKWNNTPVLQDTAYFNQMVNTSQQLNKSYGYLWWLNGKGSFMAPGLQFVFPFDLNPSAPDDMIAALGKNGQIINVVPSQNLVYIRMGNVPDAGEVPVTFNDTVWQKLNAVMCGITDIEDRLETTTPVHVYPNPALQSFAVELPEQTFDVAVFDATGRRVYEAGDVFQKIEIESNRFANGLYTVRVTARNQARYYRKVLVAAH